MIFCAGLKHNLSALLGDAGIVSPILIGVGLMLIIVEFYQPSYGIPISCGTVLTLCGIVLRMFAGGTVIMLFFMVFFCAVILCGAHLLMLRTQKRIWLTQSLALKLQNSMREDDDDDGYEYLLHREGVATTDIDGNGHVLIDDVNFFVSSDSPISKGTAVKVVAVSGDSISVTPV